MENEQEIVHIFSVHEPGTRLSRYVWRPVAPGNEILTYDEILQAELEVQKRVDSPTAIVKYFATAGKASVHGADDGFNRPIELRQS